MKPNVFITARVRGKRVYHWEGHNTWTEVGREYLARLLSYSSFGPDVVAEHQRIKHLQLGVGGVSQSSIIDATVDAAYPAGHDPHATDGRAYNHKFPVFPLIHSLERPIRLTGGSNPYPSADPTDVWMTSETAAGFFVTRPAPGHAAVVRYILDAADGEVVYAPFTTMPLSELGLVVGLADNAAAPSIHTPFPEVVAYVNFDTLPLTTETDLEIAWSVGF